jgi:pSer/pThr/pTyr-binding forkhead associated (FHA) protein
MSSFGLKFISGKFLGGEFPVPDNDELIIGRSGEAELVLAEDMVSRKHARIAHGAAGLTIEDLGSTNGTFVNGEKIKQCTLKRSDRILVGTSILKVIDGSDMAMAGVQTDRANLKQHMKELVAHEVESSSMSGGLDEVPLPDLLQLFSTNRKSGVLVIKGPTRGKVYIKEGQVELVVIDGDPSMDSRKALFRMVGWDRGSFKLEALSDERIEPVISEPTESLLMEAMRQHDEMKMLLSRLPELDSGLEPCVPMTPKLSDLSKTQLDILQLCLNFDSIQSVIDKAAMTDFEALALVDKLLQDGYLELEI